MTAIAPYIDKKTSIADPLQEFTNLAYTLCQLLKVSFRGMKKNRGIGKDERTIIAVILKSKGLSLKEVAQIIGRKDHTSIIYHLRKFDAWYGRYTAFTIKANYALFAAKELGYDFSPLQPETMTKDQKALKMKNEGKANTEIMEALNVDYPALKNLITKAEKRKKAEAARLARLNKNKKGKLPSANTEQIDGF